MAGQRPRTLFAPGNVTAAIKELDKDPNKIEQIFQTFDEPASKTKLVPIAKC